MTDNRAYSLPPGTDPQDVCTEIIASYRRGLERWTGMRQRQGAVLSLVNGWWQTVFPDDVSDTELPMVANIFRTTTEDGGRMFAEQEPFERVYPAAMDGQRQAELRERIVNAYSQRSNLSSHLEYHGMDMIAAGYTAIKVWPDFRKPPSERFPRFQRLHPLSVLPESSWRPEEATDNICVHYSDTLTRLRQEFPEAVEALMQKMTGRVGAAALGYDLTSMFAAQNRVGTLQILDWYSSRYIARVALYSAEGRDNAELLTYIENKTELCPVQLAYRPSWGSEPLGQLDDSKGIVQAKNRSWRMLLDYFVEMVYGGKVAWNIQNPYERGPGVVYRALGPDGKLEPVTPNVPSFQAFNLVAEMESEAEKSSFSPSSRSGEVAPRTPASALRGSQGQLYSVTKSLQRNFAMAKQNANEAALAQDEVWCEAKDKRIFGVARGKRFEAPYTPSKDIAGDHSNVVSYGASSGLDMPTHMVLWENMRATRSVSLETFLENVPSVEDVPEELSRIRAETLQEAFIVSLTDPTHPPAERDAAMKAFSEGSSLAEVIDILAAHRASQPTMQQVLAGGGGGGGGGMSPVAPPGLPGAQAGALPPLPPLQTLRTPRVVPGGAGPRAPQYVRQRSK
jgi:hypothetical protein